MSNSSNPSEEAREYVRRSLRHYGDFFANIAKHSEVDAENSLQQISLTDNTAKQSLNGQEFQYYWNRRNYLMNLFYEQLSREVRGQLQEDLIRDAKGLIDQLEVIVE